MAEADQEKLILEWCGHLSVPRWVDEKLYNNCKSCSAKMDGFLTKKDKHHCRLCGQMFCSACTQKYNLPLIFRVKNKDGPARVCMSCVDGCLAEKEKASAPAASALSVSKLGHSALSSLQMSASQQSMVKVLEIAPPATWEEESQFIQCPKCSAKKCKTHNCRVCGKLLCDKCTSKMDIPACFERKKGKTGPSRVCDSCRYKVVNGAKLVEKLSGPAVRGTPFNRGPPAAPAGVLGVASASSSASSPPLSPIGAGGAFHASNEVIHAVVKREGDGTVVAKIAIPGADTSLATIDVLLKKTAPQGEAYSYVFRGAPIPDAFFGVFFARHLGATLLIRPKHKTDLVSLQEEDMDGSEFNGGGGDAAVHAPSNPFNAERVANLDAARAAATGRRLRPKVEPKPVVAPVVVFKRPVLARQVVKFDVTRGGGAGGPPKKTPPALPGAAAAAGLGGTGDEVFKRRAKALFGDKPKSNTTQH